jgi:hypothetical protein
MRASPADELLVRTVDLDRPIREEDDQAGVLDDDALAGDADLEDRSRLRHDVVLDVIRRTRQVDEVRPVPGIVERLTSRVRNHSVEVVVHDDVRRSAVGIEEHSEGAVLDDVLVEEERSAVDIERDSSWNEPCKGFLALTAPAGEAISRLPASTPATVRPQIILMRLTRNLPASFGASQTWEPHRVGAASSYPMGLRFGNPPFPPGTEVARHSAEIGLGRVVLARLALLRRKRASVRRTDRDPLLQLALRAEILGRDP